MTPEEADRFIALMEAGHTYHYTCSACTRPFDVVQTPEQAAAPADGRCPQCRYNRPAPA